MARYNEILVGRYNRLIQKLFSMKGGPPTPQLASDVQVAFPLFSGEENRYLEGWDSFATQMSVAAVAATFAKMRIRNPPTSGVIAVFQRITPMSGAGFDNPILSHFFPPPAVGDLTSAFSFATQRLDARGKPNPAVIGSTENSAGVSGNISQVSFVVNTMAEYIIDNDHNIPLLPGDALQVTSNVLNQALTCSWRWRERPLELSEAT